METPDQAGETIHGRQIEIGMNEESIIAFLSNNDGALLELANYILIRNYRIDIVLESCCMYNDSFTYRTVLIP